MLQNILFLDVETVPQFAGFDKLSPDWQALWERKAKLLIKNTETETPESIYARAGIYAEFGKIICISCGFISGEGDNKRLTLKSFYGEEEKEVLLSFCGMLNRWATDNSKLLCAHNGKEFDFPFLCRRMIINGIKIPHSLNTAGKKPWEIPHIDTMELWKFGDYKNFTSLNLLAHCLDIPTPKDDIDGSMVAEVFWEQKDLQRIVNYCQKDVVTVANVYLRMNGESIIQPDYIEIK
ncbi:MAG: 3'-5' exonuclease [Bacteroidetes bacterium]|nr:3'-5' exonuclease [Bacteroidota bacterium]